MSNKLFCDILIKAISDQTAVSEYETVEAKAAAEIPHIGISNRFRGIFTASEIAAPIVPIIGFPLPISSLSNTLEMLKATIPGNIIHKGFSAGRNEAPKNKLIIILQKTKSNTAASKVKKIVLRHILGVDSFASSELNLGVRANNTVPTAPGKYHNASAKPTATE